MMKQTFFRIPFLGVLLFILAACGSGETSSTDTGSTDGGTGLTPALSTNAELPSWEDRLAALPEEFATANLDAGKRQFAKCRSCHLIGAGNQHSIGPNLYGVFGRTIGTAEGFRYSDALLEASFTWTPAELDEWLANPRGYLPGNRMTFVGLRQEKDRNDLIAYLIVETATPEDLGN